VPNFVSIGKSELEPNQKRLAGIKLQVLGAAILGIEGGEIMSVLQVAVMGNLPYTAIRDGIFAHPTLAE